MGHPHVRKSVEHEGFYLVMEEKRPRQKKKPSQQENREQPTQDSPSPVSTAAETAMKIAEEQRPANPPVLTGELVTITGTLASMTHEQAYEQIHKHGGQTAHHVSRQTTLLIIGEEGWPLEPDGKPSAKLQHAESLIEEGHPLKIVSESDWLRMLELFIDHPEVRRLYTPAMLSQLLKIPVHVIRSWERAGLIRAEKKVFRLPFFSYQEVTTARRLNDLLNSGATQQELTRSLNRLKKLLPDPSRLWEQVELLSDHQRRLVIRDQHGYLDPQTRQRFFNFNLSEKSPVSESETSMEDDPMSGHVLRFDSSSNPPPQTSTDWMVEGCRNAEMADTSAAIRCFRQALRIRPDDAEAHFYLADALYRLGKQEAALERYLCAIEHDPEYLEAWNQIGCVYADLNKWTEAIEAFDEALKVFPEFAETHLQKAETLRQMHRTEEAIVHWQFYLKYDYCGPWAELAHQRLEQAGVVFDEEDNPQE